VTAEGSDSIRLSKKQQDAFLGWALVNLLGPPPDKTGTPSLQIQFGTWNDRTVNQGQARKLMEGMRDHLKRYDSESHLQVPIEPKDLTKSGAAKLKETKGWDVNKAIDHARSGKLPQLVEVLDPKVGIVYPVGGQHRQRALAMFLEHCLKEQREAGAALVKLEQLYKSLGKTRTREHQEAEREKSRLEERISYLKGETERGGQWLVAVYNEGTYSYIDYHHHKHFASILIMNEYL
jgi:hypothetical protein